MVCAFLVAVRVDKREETDMYKRGLRVAVPLALAAILVSAVSPAVAAKKLFLQNLPYDTDAGDVIQLASPFGIVVEVEVQCNDTPFVRSALAAVRFVHSSNVDVAVEALDGTPNGDGSVLSARALDFLLVSRVVAQVVDGAGLLFEMALLQELSDETHILLADAMSRASVNGRLVLHTFDLNDLDGLDPSSINGPRSHKPREIVVVGRKVREAVREAGFFVGHGMILAVSDKVHDMIEAAIVRCTSNGRSTVRSYDL